MSLYSLSELLILANEQKKHSVKEDVASVLLSAMMGYIIKSWESVPLNVRKKEKIPDVEIQLSINSTEEVLDTKSNKSSINKNKKSSEAQRKKTKKRKSTDKKPRKQGSIVTDIDPLLPTIPETLKKEVPLLENTLESTDLKEVLEESFSLPSFSLESLSSSKYSESDYELLINKYLSDWKFLENDQEVVICFKQGNQYKGPLSRCHMHGKGKFKWSDGSKYEGDFDEGEITGNGILMWSDQSWYEGGFYKGYRHGRGLLVLNNYVCYDGDWFLGQKHGLGYLNYKDPQIKPDYYSGGWNMGRREGTGLRHYASGARYSGQWLNGSRHGLGTMVWNNNDVYSGNWNCGEIDGYGEYTWNTFFNKQFVVPQENCYYGMWKNGIRDGNGILELASGTIIRGRWSNGLKHGPAEVICPNGTFIFDKDLFVNDCVNETGDEDPSELYHVPVNAPSHDIDLNVYIERLSTYKTYCKQMRIQNNVFQQFESYNIKQNLTTSEDEKYWFSNEKTWLQNVILLNLNILKSVYKKYAEIGSSSPVNFKSVMTRIVLWQLWRDCGFHNGGLSLAEIDIIFDRNTDTLMQSTHYPFERIHFWQFLHCLIELSWHFYILNYEHSVFTVPAVLGSALDALITQNLLPNVGYHVGNALFKYRDLLSIDATYWFYRGLGETLSARSFIKNIIIPDKVEKIPLTYYPSYALQGTNAFTIGGTLMYSQGEEPLTHHEDSPINEEKLVYSQPLSSLCDIGIKRAIRNLLLVCPSITMDGFYVKLDYQLVFLEFYELLLLCAKSSIKKSMWIQKREEEIEKKRLELLEEEKMKLLEDESKVKKTKSEDKKKTAKSEGKRKTAKSNKKGTS